MTNDIEVIPKTVYKYKEIHYTSLNKAKNKKLEDDMKELLKTFEGIWHGTWIRKSDSFPIAKIIDKLDIAIYKAKEIKQWVEDNVL